MNQKDLLPGPDSGAAANYTSLRPTRRQLPTVSRDLPGPWAPHAHDAGLAEAGLGDSQEPVWGPVSLSCSLMG